jgi:hypothetical protein
VWIGTCGYSYPDWKGVFYPPDMKDSDFLRFYSERFACVEIDSTYYRIPDPLMFDAVELESPQQEIAEDLVTTISRLSGKLYGLRSHKYSKVVQRSKEVITP